MCTGLSFSFVSEYDDFESCFSVVKDFLKQIYESKDCLKISYLKLSIRLSFVASYFAWSRDILRQMAQLLIKIIQDTSINAIAINGFKFSIKQIEYFNFWFTPPFGEATINKKGDQIVLVRYLNNTKQMYN